MLTYVRLLTILMTGLGADIPLAFTVMMCTSYVRSGMRPVMVTEVMLPVAMLLETEMLLTEVSVQPAVANLY